MKTEIKGKFIIGFDTICDGNQTSVNDDGQPNLYDSEAEARIELFSDAIAGLEGADDDYFEENELDKDKVLAEMRDIFTSGDKIDYKLRADKMKTYLSENPSCNYYDEFIEKAEDFVLGRKAIFTGEGVVIEGTKFADNE